MVSKAKIIDAKIVPQYETLKVGEYCEEKVHLVVKCSLTESKAISAEKPNLIILLDVSHSMKESNVFQNFKSSIITDIIDKFYDAVNFYLIDFGRGSNIRIDANSKIEKEKAIDVVQSLKTSAHTDVLGAFKNLKKIRKRLVGSKNIILFVTDGYPTTSSDEEVIKYVSSFEISESDECHIIGILPDVDKRFIKKMANILKADYEIKERDDINPYIIKSLNLNIHKVSGEKIVPNVNVNYVHYGIKDVEKTGESSSIEDATVIWNLSYFVKFLPHIEGRFKVSEFEITCGDSSINIPFMAVFAKESSLSENSLFDNSEADSKNELHSKTRKLTKEERQSLMKKIFGGRNKI